jgi:Zn-dependent peptidase ImmA (M78 family)
VSVGIDRAIAEKAASLQLARFYPNRPLTPPVDPFRIAAECDIVVEPLSSMAPGISGCLMYKDGVFGILYANHLPSLGFRRFTVAHELGHYFIDDHAQRIISTGIHTSRDDLGSSDPIERQANFFAAALLMPEREFNQALWHIEADLDGVQSLAERFDVSLTAAAIRMTNLSDEAVAVVVSSGTSVEYCLVSSLLNEIPQLKRPSRGEALSRSTATFRLNKRIQEGDNCTCISDTGTLDDWFEGMPDLEVIEEALYLGHGYGKTLTIVSCDLDPDELDVEDLS